MAVCCYLVLWWKLHTFSVNLNEHLIFFLQICIRETLYLLTFVGSNRDRKIKIKNKNKKNYLSGVRCHASVVRCQVCHLSPVTNTLQQPQPGTVLLLTPSLCTGCYCWSWPRSINNEKKKRKKKKSMCKFLIISQSKLLNLRIILF